MSTKPKRETAGDATTQKPKRKHVAKKKHRGLHPPLVAEYLPKKKWLKVPSPNNENVYWGLTDQSSYTEYAWAFLRRNRFYQQLCDRDPNAPPLSYWGYRVSEEREWGYGVTHLKHYSEPFMEKPPGWDGIHPFIRQLRLLTVKRHAGHAGHAVTIDFPADQVAVIFDLAPMMAGLPVIEAQLALAKVQLLRLAYEKAAKPTGSSSKTPFKVPKRAKGPLKSLLRAQLRVADLFSAPEEVSVATEGDQPPSEQQKFFALNASRGATGSSVHSAKDIVQLVPTYDLKRRKEAAPTKEQRIKRISELAVGAWEGIYNWRMLRWLQFDDWATAFPAEPVQSTKQRQWVAAKKRTTSTGRTANKRSSTATSSPKQSGGTKKI